MRTLSAVRNGSGSSRLLGGGVAVAGLLVMIGMAASGYAATGDSVVGRGAFDNGEHFVINAQGGATDTTASGTLNARRHNLFVKTNVTCLHVVGNNAWVGVIITDSNVPSLLGHEEVDIFHDNSP
jgi:hypothetical protein